MLPKRYPTIAALCLTFTALMVLSGCGVKPSRLDPPPGAEDRTFPNTYPSSVDG